MGSQVCTIVPRFTRALGTLNSGLYPVSSRHFVYGTASPSLHEPFLLATQGIGNKDAGGSRAFSSPSCLPVEALYCDSCVLNSTDVTSLQEHCYSQTECQAGSAWLP